MLTHFLLALLTLVPAQPVKEVLLDLTAPVSPEAANGPRCASDNYSIARLVGVPAPKMPLRMTFLIGPEFRAYKLGEEIVHEILVENVGREPYVIPWVGLTDLQQVRPEPCGAPPGFKWFILALRADHEGAAPDVVWAIPIIGSDLMPGSLKELKPGERVRIRAKGRLSLFSTAGTRQWLAGAQSPVSANLKAVLTPFLGFTPPTIPEPVTSENSITITISQ